MRWIGLVLVITLLQSQSLQDIVDYSISHNQKIKALEVEIAKLENQIKIARKWDNPVLNFGFNALYLDQPLYRGDPNQTISIGLSQKLDLTFKKSVEGDKFVLQKQIKLLELKKLKKDLIKRIKLSMIQHYQDSYRIKILNSTLNNLEILKNQFASASNEKVLIQIYKFEILQTKLKIKLQQIKENQKSKMIDLNEASFGDFKDILFQENFVKKFPKDFYQKSYELQILEIQKKIDQQDISLAKRSFFADPTLNIGYFYREKQQDFLSFSIAFPLPFYGKEGLVLSNAQKQKMLTQNLSLDKENAIKSRINRLLNIVQNKEKELKLIQKNLIPQNQKLLALLQKNIASGSFSDVSEYYLAFNELLESKLLEVDVLGSIWSALSELESIGE